MDCEHNGKSRGAEAQACPGACCPNQIQLGLSVVFPWAMLFPESTMDNQTGAAENRFYAKCGVPLVANASFCAACGQHVDPLGTQAALTTPTPPVPQAAPAQPANVTGFSQQGLRYPRCGSTQVQAAKRGWKWTTGMIGSGNMEATCLQCGNKFDLT